MGSTKKDEEASLSQNNNKKNNNLKKNNLVSNLWVPKVQEAQKTENTYLPLLFCRRDRQYLRVVKRVFAETEEGGGGTEQKEPRFSPLDGRAFWGEVLL